MSRAGTGKGCSPYRLVLLVAVLSAGGFLGLSLRSSLAWYDQWLRGDHLRDAERIAGAIPYSDLRQLTGTQADSESPAYLRLKRQMASVQALGDRWEWIYLMGMRDGKVFFYMDSGESEGVGPARPGEVFEEASPLLHSLFRTRIPCVEGPERDHWGIWISAFVPICDPVSGETVAVLGVDVPAQAWQDRVDGVTRLAIGLLAAGGCVFLVWFALRRRRPGGRFSSVYLDAVAILLFGVVVAAGMVRFALLRQAAGMKDRFRQAMEARAYPIVEELHDLQEKDLPSLRAIMAGRPGMPAAAPAHSAVSPIRNACVQEWGRVSTVRAGDTARSGLPAPWEANGEGKRAAASGRAVYYPLGCAEPDTSAAGLAGYDVGSTEAGRQALAECARTGLVTATPPLRLPGVATPVFLALCPVWSPPPGEGNGRNGPGSEECFAAVVGGDALRRAAESVALELGGGERVAVDLVSLDAPGRPGGGVASSREAEELAFDGCGPLRVQYPILAFGGAYALRAYAAGSPRGWGGWEVWGRLLTALFASLAVALLVVFLAWRRGSLETLVAKRTDELRGSLDRLDQLAAHSRTFSWEMDANGLYTYLTPSLYQLLGYRPEELVGKVHCYDLHPPEGRERFAKRVLRSIPQRNSFRDVSYPVLAKGGETVWISSNGVPITGEGGELLGYRGTVRGVSEERQARLKEEFQYAFQKLAADVSRSFLAAGESGFDAVVSQALRQLGELFGADRAYLFSMAEDSSHGTNTHEWCAEGIAPQIGDLQNLPTSVFPYWTALLAEGKCVHVPSMADMPPEAAVERTLLGELQILSLICLPMRDDGGRLVGFLGMDSVKTTRRWPEDQIAMLHVLAEIFANAIVRGETQRALVRSRGMYRLLTEGMRDVVWVLDAETLRCLYVSPPVERLLGYSVEEIMLLSPSDVMALDDADQVAASARQHVKRLRAGTAPYGVYYTHEGTHIRKDGAAVSNETVACYWLDHESGRIWLHGVTRDVSELRRAEDEKERLTEQLVQAQKLESVGRLAGGVAHDFNNMLQGILGYTEMALEQVPPGEQLHADLEEIQKMVERSADLTRQLLAFARQQPVEPRVVDLNEVVSDMLGMLRRLIGEDIRLVWQPQGELWPVKLDPTQMGMVLANLSVNARDAIEGGGRIVIESRNVVVDDVCSVSHADAAVGEYAMVSVSDTGCGIPAEVLPRIFDPFFTTKEVGKGTGLGLATVHGIALQNGGFVGVYSELGSGTAFRVYFPRYLGEGSMSSSRRPEGELAGGVETVLVVEDEPALLRMCGQVLERLGYRTLLADHPAQALALSERCGEALGLLITDVVMPDMDGKELADRLMAANPTLSCLYMSGYPETVISHQGMVETGLDFIAKPFTRQAFAKKVRELLDRREGEVARATG